MPFYEFGCPEGHKTTVRFSFAECPELVACACGQPASRAVVNHVAFYGAVQPARPGERLQDVHDAARELEDRAKGSDDPAAKTTELVAHAAKVRSEARLLQGQARFDVQTGAAT